MFADPSKGSAVRFNTVQLIGPGTLVTECYHCGHDDEYTGIDLSQFKATEDRPSFRDRRPTASGSPRQKLQPRYPGAKVIFGVGALEHRQECAVVISRSVIYWTYVESTLANLLSFMLKAQTEPAVEMFLSLRNARAKTDALEAVAELTLAPEPAAYEMYQAIMRYKDAVEKERNHLVHGIFGISSAVQNGVIWMSTADYTTHTSKSRLFGLTSELETSFLKKLFVYELGDIETVAREIENVQNQIQRFISYLAISHEGRRNEIYGQLCNEPRLATEIALLRQGLKNKT
jgi:hypothetical protein